jgi:hypothetical protein
MDKVNPYESPEGCDPSRSAKVRRNRQLVWAMLISALGPSFTTGLSNLIIVLNHECNTFECRRAHTMTGVGYGAFAAALIMPLIAILPDWVRVFASLLLLMVWTAVASFVYHYYISHL